MSLQVAPRQEARLQSVRIMVGLRVYYGIALQQIVMWKLRMADVKEPGMGGVV